MAKQKQKLELTWIGKDERVKLEPRILIEDPAKSYGDPTSENMLIHGDNLLTLKALEQDFAGKIKCVYIDPPYNTGSAFEHYDDNLEHSTWLSLMRPRLEVIKKLLHPSGSLWISIDDDECHYLKLLCDEVFGRNNFVTSCIWQKIHSIKNDAKYLSENHDYILLYAKDKNLVSLNLLPRSEEMDARYKNLDNDPRGPWQSGDLVANEERTNGYFEIIGPTGKVFNVPKGKHWVYAKDTLERMIDENRVWFGKKGDAFPRKKRFLSEVQQGKKADTWWRSDDVGHNQEAKREMRILFSDDPFETPKPERLLKRVIELSTNEGDWVMDSFLGSGTSSAVSHKMGRKHIGVEFGDHAVTHCLPRLKKVVDGNDGLKLSKELDWQGGGGFKFYNLAPSLLKQDIHGNWVIDEKYNATMLAHAVCKHEGFRFEPHVEIYWKQGKSTETDFIFVTTNFVTVEQLDSIYREMLSTESLLVCAKSFDSECENKYPNITTKKIPKMILGRCEFGKENYDLNIIEKTEEAAEEQMDNDE